MTASALPEINKYVKEGHYHVACTRVFEITHNVRKGDGVDAGESVTHPNKYVQRSRELAAPVVATDPVGLSAVEPMVEG